MHKRNNYLIEQYFKRARKLLGRSSDAYDMITMDGQGCYFSEPSFSQLIIFEEYPLLKFYAEGITLNEYVFISYKGEINASE